MNNEDTSSTIAVPGIPAPIDLPEGTIYWSEYQETQRRKFLKQLHPLMLSENGYVTTEGTKPHGVKSKRYGKGTGVKGVCVLWDKHYALEKIKYHLQPLSFSLSFEEWFIGLSSIYLGSSIQDKKDDLMWLKQWVLQEQSKLTKPDSPRQKKAHELLDCLDSLIAEKEGGKDEM